MYEPIRACIGLSVRSVVGIACSVSNRGLHVTISRACGSYGTHIVAQMPALPCIVPHTHSHVFCTRKIADKLNTSNSPVCLRALRIILTTPFCPASTWYFHFYSATNQTVPVAAIKMGYSAEQRAPKRLTISLGTKRRFISDLKIGRFPTPKKFSFAYIRSWLHVTLTIY